MFVLIYIQITMFEIKNDLSSTVVEVDEEMKYNNIM